MRAGAGKSKGGDFERYALKRLSRWVSNGARDDLFWRTATSGGRATFQLRTQGVVNLAQAGDLTAISVEGYPLASRALFEFKHLKNLNISEGLIKGTGSLKQFWDRCLRDAVIYGKEPVLIARQNLFPTVLVVRTGSELFSADPILISPRWGAVFYLFEDATRVDRPKMVRRVRA